MPPISRTLSIVLPVLAAVALAGVLGSRDFVPPGPTAEDPGYGPGADWDVQWEMAGVAEAHRREGLIPHWDPFSQYGVPQLANPESFTLHPAFLIGSRLSTRSGLKALYTFQCLVFFLGLWWLGRRLRIPWFLAMAAGTALVVSPEWSDRILAGHIMFLGVSAWPAVIAAVLAALDPDQRSHPWRQLLLGATAGGALALANLGGGHYPTALGLTAAVILVWAVAAPRQALIGLLVVLAIPLALPTAPTWARFPLVAAGAGLILWGVWRSDVRLAQLRALGGVALGVLAVGGFRILPEGVVMALSARPLTPGRGNPLVDLLPLHLPWTEPWHGLEGYLYYSWVGWLALLLIGVLALARVHRGLAFLTAAFLLLAWTAGRPAQPWELVGVLPGMSAVNYPMRMQWMLPLLAPLGAVALAFGEVRDRLGRPWALGLALILTAGACVGLTRHLAHVYPSESQGDDVIFTSMTEVQGTTPDPTNDPLATAAEVGLIHPRFGTALAFGSLVHPEGLQGYLGWVETSCGETPDTGTARVTGSLAGWEITAPPGTTVTVAQRDLAGWRCDGGERVEGWCDDSPEGLRPAGRGHRWLRIRVGDTGRAHCRWHSPGLAAGIVLQILALALLGLAAFRSSR